MPITPTDVHVNRPLTNVMIDWRQQNQTFAWNRVFPIVNVDKQSDSYFVWNRDDFFRDEMRERAPGAPAAVTSARLSNESYNCKVWGLAEKIDDQLRANTDSPLNLDMSATRRLTAKANLRFEKLWVSRFFTTGVWTGATTGTDLVGASDFTKFAGPSTGSPVSVLRAQIQQLTRLGIPKSQIKLTMGPEVFTVLEDHDDFLSRYEQTQAAIMTEQLMAAVLGIGEVIVPMGVENPNAEGDDQAGNENVFVAGDSMLLSFAPPNPTISDPSAGYTFAWTGLVQSADGMRMLRMRDDMAHSDHIEVEAAMAPKATAPECGIFFSDCI